MKVLSTRRIPKLGAFSRQCETSQRFADSSTDKSTFEAEGRDDGGLVDDGGAGEGVDQAEDELLGQAPVKARPAVYVQGASLAHTRATALRRLRGS